MRKVAFAGLLIVATVTSCRDGIAPVGFLGAKYVVTVLPAAPRAGSGPSVTAQLVDSSGARMAVAGRSVRWSSPNGGGFVPAVSITASDGSATASMVLPTKAGNTYQVEAIDDAKVAGASDRFTVLPADPARYVVTPSANTAVAGSTITISAQLADGFANPVSVAGRVVTWTVQGNLGESVSQPTSTSDSNGMATVSFTLGKRASNTYIVFLTDDHALRGASSAIRTTAGAPDHYTVAVDTSELDPPAGAAVTVFAKLTDANGNILNSSRRVITWSATGAGGRLSTTTSTVGDSSGATVVLTTSSVVGTAYTVSASDGQGLTGTSQTITAQPQVVLSSIATGIGSRSVCGTSAGGQLWCWGANESGQLGTDKTPIRNLPIRTGGSVKFISVSVGMNFACGIGPSGTVYCWGDNAFGELGDGTRTQHANPAPVSSPLAFQSVTAGYDHVCGLAANGDAYCWGNNGSAQIGAVTTGYATTPTKVSGGLSFVALSAGGYHTCGITMDGRAYCWGGNYNGELGTGLQNSTEHTPREVSGALKFVSISAGGSQSCGIVSGGTAYCWGYNGQGQLGLGSSSVQRISTPAVVAGNLAFASITAGWLHTCGLTTAGAAYCWGDNTQGELGTGAPQSSDRPVSVAGGFQFQSLGAASTFVQSNNYYYYGPATTDAHTCGVTTAGVAYCWGSNSNGQLGAGISVTNALTPLKVAGQP